MGEQYRVVFTGQLLKGRDPQRVSAALAQRLGAPPVKVGEWISGQQKRVLGKALELEEARRLRMELAGIGVVTIIEPMPDMEGARPAAASSAGTSGVLPHVAVEPDATAPDPEDGLGWPWLRHLTPLRWRWMLAPGMVMASVVSVMVVALHGLLVLGLLFAVVFPSVATPWAGTLVGSALLGLVLQLLVVTTALLALMLLLKPLLSLRWHGYQGVLLLPQQEPDLHAFIEDVCQRIHCPVPDDIYLQHAPRVDAHLHHSPAGFLRGRVVLRLGVPLVAGINTSQLAALIAQAMNRFRPKYQPRANSVILALQGWLQAALHQPDVVDRQLLHWHAQGQLSDGFLRLLQRVFSLDRWPLLGWLLLSQLVAHRPIHRLVADADKMALAFAGTEGHLRQLDQLRLLEHSNREMMSGLAAHWQAGEPLPENLVHDMVLQARQYPSSMAQQLRNAQQHTHRRQAILIPCDNLRLARIVKQQVQSSYECLSPAASLFSHYSKLTRWMTLRYYHHELHLPVSRQQLQRQPAAGSAAAAMETRLEQVFAGLYRDFPVLGLKKMFAEIVARGEAQVLYQEMQARCASELDRARYSAQILRDNQGVMLNTLLREEVHMAGLWREWEEGRLRRGELEQLHQQARDSEQEYTEAVQGQQRYLYAYGRRLAAALVLASQRDRALIQEISTLLGVLERVEMVSALLRELSQQTLLLEVLLSYQGHAFNKRIRSRIEQRSSDVHAQLVAIGVNLKQAPYPFPDSRKRALMDYLLAEARTDNSAEAELDRGMDVLDRLPPIQGRVMLRLLELAGM